MTPSQADNLASLEAELNSVIKESRRNRHHKGTERYGARYRTLEEKFDHLAREIERLKYRAGIPTELPLDFLVQLRDKLSAAIDRIACLRASGTEDDEVTARLLTEDVLSDSLEELDHVYYPDRTARRAAEWAAWHADASKEWV
jgi:hypothetical protein